MFFPEAEVEKVADGLARESGCAVHERDVQSAARGGGDAMKRFEPGHRAAHIGEGKFGDVEIVAVVHHAVGGLAIGAGGRGFAEANRAIVVGQLEDDDGVVTRACGTGDLPRVRELQRKGAEVELHVQIR